MTALILLAAIAVASFIWLTTHYTVCPCCGEFVAKDKMRYVSEDDDIELCCSECGYSFCLTDKTIDDDGTINAEIDPHVWNEDYARFQRA